MKTILAEVLIRVEFFLKEVLFRDRIEWRRLLAIVRDKQDRIVRDEQELDYIFSFACIFVFK